MEAILSGQPARQTVLVAYATKMGSTGDIAWAIGKQLAHYGFRVSVRAADRAPDARRFDAVILGSAVYLGHWQRSAIDYLKHHAPDLAERPVWLFQSGPCGDDAEVTQQKTPRPVSRLCAEIGVDLPTTFGGRLDRTKARGPLARWVADGSLAGDFRDWPAIQQWTADIAHRIEEKSPRTAVPSQSSSGTLRASL